MVRPFGPSPKALDETIRQTAQQAKYAGSALFVPENDQAISNAKITKQNYHNIYENN